MQPKLNDWKLIITRNMSFMHQWFSSIGHVYNTKDYGVDSSLHILGVTEHGTKTSAFTQPDDNAAYSAACLAAVDSKEKVNELTRRYERFAQELYDALAVCDANVTAETWNQLIPPYTRLCAGLTLTSMIGRAGLEKLTQLLQKAGIPENQISEYISALTYPEDHTPLFDSQLRLLEIGKDVQVKNISDAERVKRLQGWLDDFGIIPVNFCEDPWTLEDAQKQLEGLLSKNCAEELVRLEKSHEEINSRKKTLLSQIKNEEIENISYALARATQLNEFRKNAFSRVSLGYRNILAHVASLCGADNWRDCFYLTPFEISDVLSGKNVPLAEIKNIRQIVGYYMNEKGEMEFMKPKVLDEFATYLKNLYGASSEKLTDTSVKGFSASRGTVRGIAKVIMSSKDFHKLNPGDILVTTMTSVDFVPIMEKAAAFVTNEGGITSHASIVAREMKKPCVIGTKIATQVFKDGDLVEVDANNGIVRIIN